MSEPTVTSQQQDTPDAAEAKPHAPSGKVAAIREAKPGLSDMGEALEDMEPATAKARKEAASYRQRLRETEAERDDLAARLDHARRAMLKNTKEFGRINPTALDDALAMLDADTVAALFTDDGDPDPEATKDQVAAILENRPYMAKPFEYDRNAVKTALLAENPQGAVGGKGDPLRSALRR